jgi:hypothetical protein
MGDHQETYSGIACTLGRREISSAFLNKLWKEQLIWYATVMKICKYRTIVNDSALFLTNCQMLNFFVTQVSLSGTRMAWGLKQMQVFTRKGQNYHVFLCPTSSLETKLQRSTTTHSAITFHYFSFCLYTDKSFGIFIVSLISIMFWTWSGEVFKAMGDWQCLDKSN